MNKTPFEKTLILLSYAFIGWVICGSIMAVGMRHWLMPTVLTVHLIGATLTFGFLSWSYHRYFRFTRPLYTAMLFTGFVMVVDFFLVALVILKSLDMFRSLMGTWIPFGVIFVITYLIGLKTPKKGLV